MTVSVVTSPWISKIGKRLGVMMPAPGKTTQGVAPDAVEFSWIQRATTIETDRLGIYEEVLAMDAQMPEASRAIDVLADNAVNAHEGDTKTFKIVYDRGKKIPQHIQTLINSVVQRTELETKIFPFARDTLQFGDLFIQTCLDEHVTSIQRLMYMDPRSMRRNEDAQGMLKTGNSPEDAGFVQYEVGTQKPIAVFHPAQIIHLRWGQSGQSKYGRSLLWAARSPFKKLRAMEEALIVNWLTRAFARLLFKIDTTGMSDTDAEGKIKNFIEKLSRRNVASGVQGFERLTVAKDLVLGVRRTNQGGAWEESMDDVQVLDTSNTGFTNIKAVEFFRDKVISATGVPRAHLGLEQYINAKATLQWQDWRFARMVKRVQMLMSELIRSVIDSELRLQGFDPANYPYIIEWPSPSILDDSEQALVLLNLAKTAESLINTKVATPEWIAKRLFKLSETEWAEVEKYWDEQEAKQLAEPPAVPGDNGNGAKPGDGESRVSAETVDALAEMIRRD